MFGYFQCDLSVPVELKAKRSISYLLSKILMVRYLGIYEDICGRKLSVTSAVNVEIERQINQQNTSKFCS